MIFAYRKELATEPLALALTRRGWIVKALDHPSEALIAGEADIVLAPALEYARSIGVVDYALVPGVGIVTSGFAGLIKLVFNRGLTSIGSIATPDVDSAEASIAKIILSEKHDIEPRMVPVRATASLAERLTFADAALLSGDDAIFDASGSATLLDLSDEWQDMNETALPYMVAWGRVGEVGMEIIMELVQARDEAVLMLADLTVQHPHASEASSFYQSYLRGDIRYTVSEEDLAGLDALFRYAFYYTMVSDVATIKMLPDGDPVNLPDPPIA